MNKAVFVVNDYQGRIGFELDSDKKLISFPIFFRSTFEACEEEIKKRGSNPVPMNEKPIIERFGNSIRFYYAYTEQCNNVDVWLENGEEIVDALKKQYFGGENFYQEYQLNRDSIDALMCYFMLMEML